MNETDAWKNFVTTGSVIDYLRYSSIKNGKESDIPQGAANENKHRRTDYTRTEYSGTGQIGNGINKK